MSVCINTAIYLPWLVSQCRKNGVVFKRAVFRHIADATDAHHSGENADLVVNCTGLSARHLGGVEDKTMLPARGQIVVVRNDASKMFTISGSDDREDEPHYTMTREAGISLPYDYLRCFCRYNDINSHLPVSSVRLE